MHRATYVIQFSKQHTEVRISLFVEIRLWNIFAGSGSLSLSEESSALVKSFSFSIDLLSPVLLAAILDVIRGGYCIFSKLPSRDNSPTQTALHRHSPWPTAQPYSHVIV